MATIISDSPEATERLGEAWGRELEAGWVIGISGDLGAGKTCLVRGLARGLGYPGRVQSPTFAIVHEYVGGRLPLVHLDLYRLETPEAFATAVLDDYSEPEGVAVMEWFEQWAGPVPGRLRRVRMDVMDGTRRRIVYEDTGA